MTKVAGLRYVDLPLKLTERRREKSTKPVRHTFEG